MNDRPSSLQFKPGALSREEAAAYVGYSASSFDKLVAAGDMPRPKRSHRCKIRRKVWLTEELDQSLRDLPTADSDEQIDPSINQNDRFSGKTRKPVVF